MHIPQLLKTVGNTGSTNEKIRILSEHKSDEISELFIWAYDPFLSYGIHKLDLTDMHHPMHFDEKAWWGELYCLLGQLSRRELTGNAAKAAVKDVMLSATAEYAQLVPLILKRDLRIGAGVRLINKVYPDLLPEDFCMSANKYDKKKVSFPVYADTKLDGVRCIGVVGHDGVVLFSRNAKEFTNYSTIEAEIGLLKLREGFKLDGEMTMGDFQNLMRTVSRKDDGIELAKDAIYNIFDVVDTSLSFGERLAFMKGLEDSIEHLGLTHLKVVKGELIETEAELHEYYDAQLAEGHEGIMVKTLDGMYEMKRGWGWQKMKPEHTDDLEIIGYEEGLGKYVGQLGVVKCRLDNGGEVRVGSGFKDEERATLWEQREDLIGMIAEVKYQEKTNDGSLRFPIFIRFRHDK